MSCPFCNLDPKRNTVLKEKQKVFVMLSNPRLMEGHLLVVPKRHIEKLSELHEDEKKELLDTVIEFEEKILSKISPGCDVKQHHRPFLPESDLKVNHLHFHLQPRTFKDEIYKKVQVFEKDVFKSVSEDEKVKMEKLFSR